MSTHNQILLHTVKMTILYLASFEESLDFSDNHHFNIVRDIFTDISHFKMYHVGGLVLVLICTAFWTYMQFS
jgi:predicted ATPase